MVLVAAIDLNWAVSLNILGLDLNHQFKRPAGAFKQSNILALFLLIETIRTGFLTTVLLV